MEQLETGTKRILPLMAIRLLIAMFFICLTYFGFTQELRTVTVKGEAVVEFPDSKSKEEVKIEAFSKARIDALEKAFGTTDILGNSAYLRDISKGKKTETEFVFSSISNSFVKGEIIEILDEEYEEVPGTLIVNGKSKEIKNVRCTIRCKAREIPDAAANFEGFPLKCAEIACQSTKFKNNDPFFLYFKPSCDGYVQVFIGDAVASQRILPYRNMQSKYNSGVPVKTGQSYFFFSKKKEFNYFGDNVIVDSLQMITTTDNDHNRIFILFSRNPIFVPELNSGRKDELLTLEEIGKKYQVPEEMDFRQFNNWLTKARNLDRELRLSAIDIIIQK